MLDVDEQTRRIENLYRQITGQEPKRSDVPMAPIPPGVDPVDHVREQLRRVEWAVQNRLRPLPRLGAPCISLYDGSEDWVCAVELPGVKKAALSVEIGAGVLRVSGTREPPGFPRGGQPPSYSESGGGGFERTIPVPSTLDEKSLEAHLEDGVLTVVCRKDARARGNALKIEVA